MTKKEQKRLEELGDAGVLDNVLENLSIEPENATEADKLQVVNMGPNELFERFLTWNGIIGYGQMISRAHKVIFGEPRKK